MKIGDVISIHSGTVSGTPCFKNTRIPLGLLFSYLKTGMSVEDFVNDYEIEREKVYNFLEFLKETFAEPDSTKSVPDQEQAHHEGVA